MKNSYGDVAVVIPCYNEEKSIGQVVHDFAENLPGAMIYVFNNSSTDNTAAVAQKAGAEVRYVRLPGKGNVVRRMFADVEANSYIMVDGDATYDAKSAPKLLAELKDKHLDMVVGCRVEESQDNDNYRPGHRLGNKLLTGSVKKMFGGEFTDMLSGYRAFSRRFVKTFPAESKGFEIETELTVFTLEMRLAYSEIATPYSERPEGSESKLSTYKDGARILKMIISLYTSERPRDFWWTLSGIFVVASLLMFIPVFIEFTHYGTVSRFPTLIVAMGVFGAGFVSFSIGIVLRSVAKGYREIANMLYLNTKNECADDDEK